MDLDSLRGKSSCNLLGKVQFREFGRSQVNFVMYSWLMSWVSVAAVGLVEVAQLWRRSGDWKMTLLLNLTGMGSMRRMDRGFCIILLMVDLNITPGRELQNGILLMASSAYETGYGESRRFDSRSPRNSSRGSAV